MGLCAVCCVYGFNPRTRRGCDLTQSAGAVTVTVFQSTHPQGVRLPILVGIFFAHLVSIHAPAGGATSAVNYLPSLLPSFNPRTRRGCDATGYQGVRWASCFNPRTRRGCDEDRERDAALKDMFQSTHPQGVRRRYCMLQRLFPVFQSTHPQGVRLGLHVINLSR